MRTPATIAAALLTLSVAQPLAGQGTIEATLDGTERVWYLASGEAEDGPYSSGVWMDLGDTRMLVLGAFDVEDPPVETFSRGGAGGSGEMSLGSYSGSSITIAIALTGEGAGEHVLDGSSDTQVLFAPDANQMTPQGLYAITAGRLTVETAEIADGRASASGTFSGRLEPLAGGDPLEISGGRFEVSALPNVDQTQPD